MTQIKFSKKHKIKEDRFVETILNLRTHIENKKKPILIGVIAVVAAVLVVFLGFQIRSHVNQAAAETFSSGLLDCQEGRYGNAISKFKTVADNYRSSSSAPKALYMQASLYYDLGNYTLSIEAYKRYLDKYSGNDFITPSVYKGLGCAYIQSKDYNNAIAAFEGGIKKFPKDFSVPELRFRLARCFVEKQDIVSAKQQYDLIIKEFPASSYARESELKLASL